MDKQDREIFEKSIKLLRGMTDILSGYFEDWTKNNEEFLDFFKEFYELVRELRIELTAAIKMNKDYRDFIPVRETTERLLTVTSEIAVIFKSPISLTKSAKEMVEVCLRLAEIDRKYAETVVDEDKDQILNKLTIEQLRTVMQWVRENDVDNQMATFEIN